jgi:hypothetical protein
MISVLCAAKGACPIIEKMWRLPPWQLLGYTQSKKRSTPPAGQIIRFICARAGAAAGRGDVATWIKSSVRE